MNLTPYPISKTAEQIPPFYVMAILAEALAFKRFKLFGAHL